jgi:hypothetical protein
MEGGGGGRTNTLHVPKITRWISAVLRIRIGAFLTHGSGMGKKIRIRDEHPR